MLNDPSKVRNSLPEVFCRKVDLKNVSKFTRKHLCQSLFLNKVAGLSPETPFLTCLIFVQFEPNLAQKNFDYKF